MPAHLLSPSLSLSKRSSLTKPVFTAITISFVPDTLGFVNGQPLADQGIRSFYLDIKVTDFTNTKDQKKAYIHAIDQLLGSLPGTMVHASYVYVQEIKADAYGFGGLTMEHQYIVNA
ncbi:MAG: 4-oxalocrotonate tautomerase [Azospira oryzae]|nr:MAG: 4-oxalocrotonate tautomerase [Azospira oryzae]